MDPDYVSVADYVKHEARRRLLRARKDHARRDSLSLLERDCHAALRTGADIDTAATTRPDVRSGRREDLGQARPAPRREAARRDRTRRTFAPAASARPAAGHRAICSGRWRYWDEVIRITRPIYKDMKLTHYNGNSFDANPNNLFHWALIRDEVANDVEVATAGDGHAIPAETADRGSVLDPRPACELSVRLPRLKASRGRPAPGPSVPGSARRRRSSPRSPGPHAAQSLPAW